MTQVEGSENCCLWVDLNTSKVGAIDRGGDGCGGWMELLEWLLHASSRRFLVSVSQVSQEGRRRKR